MEDQKEQKDIADALKEAIEPEAAPVAPAKPAAQAKPLATPKRVLPELIDIAIDKGIRVTLTKAGYEIDGFYKGGPMRVEPDANGAIFAIDRKEKRVSLKSFDDLARLNYDWWKRSRDKSAEFINPGREWTDEFVRLGLVKRQVIFIPGDD